MAKGVSLPDRDRYHWVLVPSPLLGGSSWNPVASEMRSTHRCHVTEIDVVPSMVGEPSHLAHWADQVVALVEGDTPVVVVGHGAAVPRLPWLCGRMLAAGHPVTGLVAVDGRFPEPGLAPTAARPSFAGLIDDLVRPDEYLPPWPRWWGTLAFELVPVQYRERLLADAPMLPRESFDEPIPAVELPPTFNCHFLAFGHGYRDEMERAAAAGWQVTWLRGQHLHQLVEPAAVARALVATSAQPAA